MTQREAVLVTGASSGIGAAAVERLVEAGYAVYGGVRSDADAARLERTDGARAVRLDVTDAATIRHAYRTVAESGHPLRAVVNNAGVAVGGPLELIGLDELRRQLEVNVVGPLAVTQAFLPLLRSMRGRVVFVGSISGRLPVPYIGPYSASKAALRSLAAALRAELASAGVGVVLIEPGSVKTPIWAKGRDSAGDLRLRLGPRVGAYADVIDGLVQHTRREEARGMPAERVAMAIVRAVQAPRPRTEQLLGGAARAGALVALMPPALRDRTLLRMMRLPR